MAFLETYRQFDGRHWETGSVHNVLAFQGITAPHTGRPLSEPMLLGISGGITFGYFLFHYEGYDPQLALLTRNTFDPLQTLLERLGVVQEVLHTSSPEKAVANLNDVIANGEPAIVWADKMLLPYNWDLDLSSDYWAMMPVVVYGQDEEKVSIADRSSQPLTVPADLFLQARGRVKKDKYRIVTLYLPGLEKLNSAVTNGIWQTVRAFTEAPPKGTKRNFGLAGLQHWANMLRNTRNAQSWERFFPIGGGLFAALLGNSYSPGLFGWVHTYGSGPNAERAVYGEFLEEAANLLGRPALAECAALFRRSAGLWGKLVDTALPRERALLGEGRALLEQRHQLFIEQGDHELDEIYSIDRQFKDLRERAKSSFPLNEAGARSLLDEMSEIVLEIHDTESEAITRMQAVMS